MIYVPHEYQSYCIDFMINKPSAGLFLDMGLGKTVITLTAIDELMNNRFEVNRTLVIAPLRVASSTWPNEIKKWEHLKHLTISRVLGSKTQRVAALEQNADIYVINRDNIKWLVEYYGVKWPFDFVVIDELSSFKSASSQRFRALRKVLPFIKRIAGLTGTPTPNGLIDLWPQMFLLDRGERLGKTLTQYRNAYFKPGKRNQNIIYQWDLRAGSEEAIHSKIKDICVSMQSADYLNLPERIDVEYKIELSDEAKRKYIEMEREEMLALSDTIIDAATAAVVINKLLQIANGAVYDDFGDVHEIHNEKLDALEDIIESANGKPVLLFYSYKHDLSRIKERFRDSRELITNEDIEDWNAGRIPLLLAHPASAGHGLNLQQGGSVIVWFGLPWSLELYQQANARLHRQGQKNTVTILHLIAESTADETVISRLISKDATQKALLDAVKAKIEEYRRTS